jgi:hypothetical protein
LSDAEKYVTLRQPLRQYFRLGGRTYKPGTTVVPESVAKELGLSGPVAAAPVDPVPPGEEEESPSGRAPDTEKTAKKKTAKKAATKKKTAKKAATKKTYRKRTPN